MKKLTQKIKCFFGLHKYDNFVLQNISTEDWCEQVKLECSCGKKMPDMYIRICGTRNRIKESELKS